MIWSDVGESEEYGSVRTCLMIFNQELVLTRIKFSLGFWTGVLTEELLFIF
jgi:hypothetical protein